MHERGFNAGLKVSLVRHGAAAAVLLALVSAFLWDVLLLDRSLGAFDIILSQPSWQGEIPHAGVHQPILIDSPTAHYPQRKFDWDTLRQGQAADFNPYIFSGMQWSPQGVGAFVTSLPQLFLGLADAIDWSTWLRLFLAGLFMYLLLLELGTGRMVGLFAGVLWTFNLHQVVWLEFPQHLATQLWIPALLLCNLLVLRHRFRLEYCVALVTVNVLFFTSGYSQIALYTYIALGIFNSLYLALDSSRSGWRRLRDWLGVHLLIVSAAVFFAAGVYAEVQFISEGLRGGQAWRGQVPRPDFSLSTLWHFLASLVPPLREVTYFYTPDYYGGIWQGRFSDPHGNLVEVGRYFGVLSVLLCCYAAFGLRRVGDRHLLIALFGTLGLLFSLFYRDPVAIGALKLIPFADRGNYSRFITLIVFFGTIVAALGLQRLMQRYLHSLRGFWLALGLFALLPVGAALVLPEFAWRKMFYAYLIVGGFAAAVALLRHRPGSGRLIGALAVTVVAADLFYAGYAFNTRMDNDKIFPRNNAIRFLLNDPQPYRIAVIASEPLYHPNILSYYKLATVGGYSTVLPNAYRLFVASLFERYRITRNGILFLLKPNIAALRMLNVKYVISDEPLADRYEGLEPVLATNGHYISRLRDPLPRAYCASKVIVEPDFKKSLKRLRRSLRQQDRPVVVPAPVPAVRSARCEVSDIAVYNNGVEFTVSAAAKNLVFLPYAYSPHWQAEIDGDAVPLTRANGALVGIPVPAGESRVVVRHRNPWQVAGAVVLILGGLLLLGWLWRIPARGPLQAALLVVALLVIAKSLPALPGLRNEQVPERSPVPAPLAVERPGPHYPGPVRPSAVVLRDQPLRLVLPLPAYGLTRLQLLSATFLQRDLDYDLEVSLLDGAGERLRRVTIQGDRVRDNEWVEVDFPTIDSRHDKLLLVVETGNRDPAEPWALWLNEQGDPVLRSFYDRTVERVSSP